jgi:hypothetical protein
MLPEMKSALAKFYLGLGTLVCVLYMVGSFSGWKIPVATYAAAMGRSTGGSWGFGK